MIVNVLMKYKKTSNKIHQIKSDELTEDLQPFTLQSLMKNILTVAQFFAFFPLNGVRKDYKSLKFKWISFKTVHTLVIATLLILYTIFLIASASNHGSSFFNFVFVAWNIQAITGLFLFLNMCRNWPNLIQEWYRMEKAMSCYGPLPNLKWRFQILPTFFFITGLSDHVIFVYGTTKIDMSQATEITGSMKSYFTAMYPDFFKTYTYSIWKALLLELLNLTTTFVWQFSDLIIILLSSAIAERFKQISSKIMDSEVLTEAQWREVRKHYNGLYLLCRTLNNTISKMVLMSFLGTVYFLSISIYECFTAGTKFQTIYYAYEVLFKTLHLSMVCFYGSWVNEESVEPLTYISSVSTKDMSHEVDRLLHQMANRDTGIYGGGLFKVTRSAFLNVASVLITLQLIYVQFRTQITSLVKL